MLALKIFLKKDGKEGAHNDCKHIYYLINTMATLDYQLASYRRFICILLIFPFRCNYFFIGFCTGNALRFSFSNTVENWKNGYILFLLLLASNFVFYAQNICISLCYIIEKCIVFLITINILFHTFTKFYELFLKIARIAFYQGGA